MDMFGIHPSKNNNHATRKVQNTMTKMGLFAQHKSMTNYSRHNSIAYFALIYSDKITIH